MYIKIGTTQHPCLNFVKSNTSANFYGVGSIPETITGKVQLYSNDAFLLAEATVADYARILTTGGNLTLTNEPAPPEPNPNPDPVPNPMADLMELSVDHEYRLTLLELGV